MKIKKTKSGRIPKISPEIQNQIAADVRKGVPQEQAAIRAGISNRTLCNWLAAGRTAKSGPYLHFLHAIKKARADRLEASIARIESAAKGGAVIERVTRTELKTLPDGTILTTETVTERTAQPQWTVDAWFLERQHPDEFAGNKREVKDLREQLAALLKAIGNGQLNATHPQSQTDSSGSGSGSIRLAATSDLKPATSVDPTTGSATGGV